MAKMRVRAFADYGLIVFFGRRSGRILRSLGGVEVLSCFWEVGICCFAWEECVHPERRAKPGYK